MAKFISDQPIETKEPQIVVDPGLKPGVYRFQLVVIDEQGNESAPAEIQVQIRPIDHPIG